MTFIKKYLVFTEGSIADYEDHFNGCIITSGSALFRNQAMPEEVRLVQNFLNYFSKVSQHYYLITGQLSDADLLVASLREGVKLVVQISNKAQLDKLGHFVQVSLRLADMDRYIATLNASSDFLSRKKIVITSKNSKQALQDFSTGMSEQKKALDELARRIRADFASEFQRYPSY